MFVSGMNPVLGMTFMVSTMMIALPSAIKVFNWLGTIWGGKIQFTTPMLFALSFVSMFIIGGLSGIFMAATPVDIFIHDTYFIVAHFHYVLFAGTAMGVFGAIYFWFPKMFGRMMNETLGQGALLPDVHLLQRHVLPDAHSGRGRLSAAAGRSVPLRDVPAPAAAEPVHDDLRDPDGRVADHLCVQPFQRVELSEPVSKAAHLPQVIQIHAVLRGVHELMQIRPRVVLRGQLVDERERHVFPGEQILFGGSRPRKPSGDQLGREARARSKRVHPGAGPGPEHPLERKRARRAAEAECRRAAARQERRRESLEPVERNRGPMRRVRAFAELQVHDPRSLGRSNLPRAGTALPGTGTASAS